MITNSKLTIYHKELDDNKIETYKRVNYDKVWAFINTRVQRDNGINNDNSIEIRIPYKKNKLNVNDFSLGDYVIPEYVDKDIKSITELKNYEVFQIISIKDNNFGTEPHIHLGGE